MEVVVDVRSRLEYWFGHLDGAVCIPLNDIVVRLGERSDLDRDSRIMLYCSSGARSAAAAAQLRSLGYHNITDAGAMSAAAGEYGP